ncbi:unnamed protein product, partial [Ixodes hexagonus]
PRKLLIDAFEKALQASILSKAATGTLRYCNKMTNPCRGRLFNGLAALLVSFLLLQYGLLPFANLPGTPKAVPSNISSTVRLSPSVNSGIFNTSLGNRTESATGRTGKGGSKGSSSTMALCPLVPPNLVGRFSVSIKAPSYEEMEKNFKHVMQGGRFKPKDCRVRHRVAILIPYRDREENLRVFLHNMHQVLPRQQIDYGIFVIEQDGKGKFNRAKLFNIGYLESLELYDYDCIVFHDVDLIPEDDRNLYTCPQQPRHMSVAINNMRYRLLYTGYFGGVSALSKKHFKLVNGFSNEYWGWGAEDDDIYFRLRHSGLSISRYPGNIARYTMLGHTRGVPNPQRLKLLHNATSRYKKDGLNSVKYERKRLVQKKLYTWILADLKAPK